MIDSVGSATGGVSSNQRTQSSGQVDRARSTTVLNAVQQSTQKSSSNAPVKVFSVAQASKSGASANTRLPRGSLVDLLA